MRSPVQRKQAAMRGTGRAAGRGRRIFPTRFMQPHAEEVSRYAGHGAQRVGGKEHAPARMNH